MSPPLVGSLHYNKLILNPPGARLHTCHQPDVLKAYRTATLQSTRPSAAKISFFNQSEHAIRYTITYTITILRGTSNGPETIA